MPIVGDSKYAVPPQIQRKTLEESRNSDVEMTDESMAAENLSPQKTSALVEPLATGNYNYFSIHTYRYLILHTYNVSNQ